MTEKQYTVQGWFIKAVCNNIFRNIVFFFYTSLIINPHWVLICSRAQGLSLLFSFLASWKKNKCLLKAVELQYCKCGKISVRQCKSITWAGLWLVHLLSSNKSAHRYTLACKGNTPTQTAQHRRSYCYCLNDHTLFHDIRSIKQRTSITVYQIVTIHLVTSTFKQTILHEATRISLTL